MRAISTAMPEWRAMNLVGLTEHRGRPGWKMLELRLVCVGLMALAAGCPKPASNPGYRACVNAERDEPGKSVRVEVDIECGGLTVRTVIRVRSSGAFDNRWWRRANYAVAKGYLTASKRHLDSGDMRLAWSCGEKGLWVIGDDYYNIVITKGNNTLERVVLAREAFNAGRQDEAVHTLIDVLATRLAAYAAYLGDELIAE
jgi:hypothetical protein